MSNQNTPKEVKDQQSENSQLSLLARNSKLLTAAVVVAVVAVAIFAFNYFYLQPKEEKAQTNLTLGLSYIEEAAMLSEQSVRILATPDSLLTDSIKAQGEGFKKQADEKYNQALNGDGKFPGFLKLAGESMTDAANIATANAGLCYYHLGNIKEAIKYLDQFSAKGDKSLSPQYIAALANCYASDNQIDKAISTFQNAAQEADNAVLSPQYLLEAGLLLESQNKNDEALKVYETIKSKYPDSRVASAIAMGNVAEIDKYIERVSK